ncbi:metal ABC transporter ATP-binding protein [Veillonella sp. VA139]|uniref:metal ABC transporter ATP-binding protein n=1 Tax=Veillonella sp. VA139 TaxID=741830 RepID=UPI000F8D78EB|nr:metal ABC transporter ATP-binding protein [Veillonella sp. VA139]
MMSDSKCILKVNHLSVAYDDTVVLKDVSFQIEQGTMTAIVGPNGAGKSTLVKAMLGLVPLVEGTIELTLDTNTVSAYGGAKTNSIYNHIAYVPQTSAVDWDYPITVFEVVLMGTYRRLGWFKRPGKRERDEATKALQTVGMLDYAQRSISQLSGGQQQRVFLARALVENQEVYLLDEPFKGIDKTTESVLVKIMKEMQSAGKTLLIVHHNLQTLETYFDQVLCVNRRLVGMGSVRDIVGSPILDETYSY